MHSILRRLTVRTALSWLGLIALIAYGAGCAGAGSLPGDATSLDAPLAGLPALPADDSTLREASADVPETILGRETFMRSGTSTDKGDAIEIASAPGGLAYVMYAFPPGGDPLVSLSLNGMLSAGNEYWVGLSDYANDRWLLDGPVTAATKDYDLTGAGLVSGGGFFYFLVVTHSGNELTLDHAVVVVDGPAPGRTNYVEHAGPFLNASCMPCHSSGSAVDGVILDNYVDAQADAAGTLAMVQGDHPSAHDAADKQMIQDWVSGGAPWRATPVTYDGDVRPQVFAPVCMNCHDSGKTGGARSGAPTSVNYDTYEAALAGSDRGNIRSQAGTMPPVFSGLSLTAEQLAMLQAWLNDGTPES